MDIRGYMERIVQASGSKELVVFGPRCRGWIAELQTLFREFLLLEHKRIKALSLGDYEHDFEGFPDSFLENIRALSIDQQSSLPFRMLIGAQNLQAFQLSIDSDELSDIILHVPSHLKKLSLCLSHNVALLKILSKFKSLDYLSIFILNEFEDFDGEEERVSLPKLMTFKSNFPGPIIDKLDAPALRQIEIATGSRYPTRRKLLHSTDLSGLTHLYIGYSLSYGLINSIDCCIQATVGPINAPCLSDMTTIFNCLYDENWTTTWPSSWSIKYSDFNSIVKPPSLIHVHTVSRSPMLVDNYVDLPCRLIAEMRSLDTLVLPAILFPPRHFNSSAIPESPHDHYKLQTAELFKAITQSSTLRNLVFRTTSNYGDVVKMLREYFDGWSSDSCPLLESITYEVHVFVGSYEKFWEVWIQFLNQRKSTGRPLKLLRLIGCPSPSKNSCQKIDELGLETEIIWEREASDPEKDKFRDICVPQDDNESDELIAYHARGFF